MAQDRAIGGSAKWGDIAIGAAFLAAAMFWCYVSGEDLNYDFFNYHLYGPNLLLNWRFDQDYFGGGLPGYLNPLAYVPLYLMVRAGWYSLLIAAVLTALHSLNLLLVWKIGDSVLPPAQGARRAFLVVGTFLAAISPIFLAVLGSSFGDPLTSIPFLAGLLVLIQECANPRWERRRFAAAGLFLGLAVGLKLSGGILVAGTVLALAPFAGRVGQRWIGIVALVLGCIAGVALTHGYWSYILWREFGNPLFPLANNIFKAADFPPVMFQDRRYLQGGLEAMLLLPLRMLEFRTTIYSESVSPDIRPLVLFVLAAVAPLAGLLSARQVRSAACPDVSARRRFATAVFATCFIVWAATSRIGRYALPLWLLAGPLIAAWAARLFVPRRGLLFLIGVCVIQLVQLYYVGNPRYTPARWHAQWLKVRVPPDLRRSAYLYLVLGQQSWSAIIPYFQPDSSFANVVGQYVVPGGKRMPQRLRSLLDRYRGRTKVIFDYVDDQRQQGFPSASMLADVDAALSIYGVRVDAHRACELVRIRFDRIRGWIWSARDSSRSARRWAGYSNLQVCSVVPGRSTDVPADDDTSKRVDQAFSAVERACPDLVSPPGMQTIRGRGGWERFYFNSVNKLLSDGHDVYIRPFSGLGAVELGSVKQWLANKVPHDCGEARIARSRFIE